MFMELLWSCFHRVCGCVCVCVCVCVCKTVYEHVIMNGHDYVCKYAFACTRAHIGFVHYCLVQFILLHHVFLWLLDGNSSFQMIFSSLTSFKKSLQCPINLWRVHAHLCQTYACYYSQMCTLQITKMKYNLLTCAFSSVKQLPKCKCVCVCARVCTCARVCMWERERECVCVFAYPCIMWFACMCMYMHHHKYHASFKTHFNLVSKHSLTQHNENKSWLSVTFYRQIQAARLRYTIQNKLRTNCSQTCQRQSFELNDLKF